MKEKTFRELFEEAKKSPIFWIEKILLEIDTELDRCQKAKKNAASNHKIDWICRMGGIIWVKNRLVELENEFEKERF